MKMVLLSKDNIFAALWASWLFYDFRLMSFFKSSLLSKKYRFHIIYSDNASNTIFILLGVLEIAFFICLFNEIWFCHTCIQTAKATLNGSFKWRMRCSTTSRALGFIIIGHLQSNAYHLWPLFWGRFQDLSSIWAPKAFSVK